MLLLLLLLAVPCSTQGPVCGDFWSSGAWMCQAYCVKVSAKSESPIVFTEREKGMLLVLLLSVPCSTQGPVCGDFWSSGAWMCQAYCVKVSVKSESPLIPLL